MIRALLYGRVSTEAQAEKYGLEAQLVGLRARAAERGYEIVPDGDRGAFSDDGYSGGDLNRPALERLRQVARDGRADLVLVFDPDRLSRSLADLLLLADEFERVGVRLEFVTQEVDASPEGRLFFAIRGAVGEFEKAKIRERMLRGKREKARQGKVVTPSSLPCWLQSDDGGTTVRLDPHWAEVARLVWRLYLDEGLTLRKVAERLTLLSYRTPTGGTHWQPTVIQAWLRNPAAKGEFCQFRFRAAEPKRRRKPVAATAHRRPESSQVERPAEEWSRIPVPALVDGVTWEAAQARLERNRALARRNARRFYLLGGLLVCGECGRRLVGVYKTRTQRRYYQCGHRGALTRVDGTGACRSPYTNADRLEAAVWGQVAALLRDPELLEQELVRRREGGSPTREGLEAELQQANGRLAAIPTEMDRLVDGYGKGLIPDNLMGPRMTVLQGERKGLAERVDTLGRDLLRLDTDAEAEAGALEFAARVAGGIDALDADGRQQLLRLVVREVVVQREQVVVRTVLPGGEPQPGGLCTRPSLLAGPPAHPHHREPGRRHLAQRPQRARADAPGDLHRARRALPPAHRDHRRSGRHPEEARAPRAAPLPGPGAPGRRLRLSRKRAKRHRHYASIAPTTRFPLPCLNFSTSRHMPAAELGPRAEPDSGKPTVRDRREPLRNATMGADELNF